MAGGGHGGLGGVTGAGGHVADLGVGGALPQRPGQHRGHEPGGAGAGARHAGRQSDQLQVMQ